MPRGSTNRIVAGAAALGASCLLSCATRPSLPEGAELVPSDATFAVSVDVPAILNSEIYRRYQSDERVFGRNRLNFYQFAQATGLDPSRDVRKLLFMARAGEEGLEDMSALVMGTFDGLKVHDFLVKSGLPSREVSGVDIFEFIVIEDRCRFCLAVIDSSTAAFGDGETLARIARIRSGEEQALASQERAARLLRRVSPDAEAWGILRADDLKGALAGALAKLSSDAGALGALGPIHEAAFSFDTAEPMRVLVEMTASSDEQAILVADVLKGAESLGRLALKEARPELARAMSDLVIEADTGVVRVAGSLPSSDLETVTRVLGIEWLREGGLTPEDDPEGKSSP